MKSILVPIEDTERMSSTLETALRLARRFGSYIEGFSLRVRISEFLALDMGSGVPPLESYQREGLEEAAQARRFFESFMREHGVPRTGQANSGVSFGWLENAPEGEAFVGNYGRVFDIIVVSRPSANAISFHNRTIESALFESGRPILLSPPNPPPEIATNIMVHWNGSTEQVRATAAAMVLLRQASRVTVLNVAGGQGVPGPSAEQFVRHLQINQIEAKRITVGLNGGSTGEAILRAAAAEGCDLLVKGAYTQSRLRQMIFGGATSHILARSELPVLMAH
jgi:nucleotide-binding universal stress UspA family protein